jgi:hypothetical protein
MNGVRYADYERQNNGVAVTLLPLHGIWHAISLCHWHCKWSA